MGILDWLTEGIGNNGGMGDSFGQGIGTPPVPPGPSPSAPSLTPATPPPPTPPDLSASGAGGASGPGTPPVPMPMPRPASASMPPTPPTPTASPAQAGPAMPITPPGADSSTSPSVVAPGGGQNGVGPIGRALGLDANTAKQLSGSLGAGLKSVGTNWNKPGFAAFAGSAGSALEGSNTTQDKTIEQQQKYLTQAIAASKAGDERGATAALTKLRLAQADMTAQGKGGKEGVANSDQQLYLRAQGATNQDPQLKLLKSQYDKAAQAFGTDSPQAKAAMEAHQKAYEETLNGHLGALGLDPKKASKMGKMPGLSQDNPIPKEKMNSQQAFDKLPPGSWFTNPKDGRVLQKPLAPQGQGGAQPAGQPAAPNGAVPGLPPPVPTIQTDPAMSSSSTPAEPATADND